MTTQNSETFIVMPNPIRKRLWMPERICCFLITTKKLLLLLISRIPMGRNRKNS